MNCQMFIRPIEFGCARRQWHAREVAWNDKGFGAMPARSGQGGSETEMPNLEAHDQIEHDAIDRRDRPFLHETNKKRLMLLAEFAGRTRRDLLTRPFGSGSTNPA
jgi:hypothetical protein